MNRRLTGEELRRFAQQLPAAVHKSQTAKTIPSEISLPLKTARNSRIRRICPTTEVNPSSAGVSQIPNATRLAFCPETRTRSLETSLEPLAISSDSGAELTMVICREQGP